MTVAEDATGVLDPILHQPHRMRIMAALHRNRQLTFPSLRDGLGLTPGNLGAHLDRLVAAGYIESARVLVGVHFEMRYRITVAGSEAFRIYVGALRRLLEEVGDGGPTVSRDETPLRDVSVRSAAARRALDDL